MDNSSYLESLLGNHKVEKCHFNSNFWRKLRVPVLCGDVQPKQLKSVTLFAISLHTWDFFLFSVANHGQKKLNEVCEKSRNLSFKNSEKLRKHDLAVTWKHKIDNQQNVK